MTKLPMPTWIITDAAELALVPERVYSGVLSLLTDYWRQGCLRLPASQSEWIAALRWNRQTWQRYGSMVQSAAMAIQPNLDAAHLKTARTAENRRRSALNASARRAAKCVAAAHRGDDRDGRGVYYPPIVHHAPGYRAPYVPPSQKPPARTDNPDGLMYDRPSLR